MVIGLLQIYEHESEQKTKNHNTELVEPWIKAK